MFSATHIPEAAVDRTEADNHRLSFTQIAILTAVVCVGAVLRILPVGYGLPFFFHPDETHLIRDLGKFFEALSRGGTTIGFSTFYYPLTFVYGLYFAFGRATGHFASLTDFEMAVVLDDPTLHVLGRAVSVGFSVGALIAVYALARRLYDHRGGLIAAVLMSVSVIDISSSHWLKFDSAVMFLSLVSLLAILRLSDPRVTIRSYAVAGLTVGLAVAGRIDLLVLVPLLIVAHVLALRPRRVIDAVRSTVQGPLPMALGVGALVYLFVSFALVDAVLQYLVGAPRPFTTREMGASLVEFFLASDVLASARHNILFYTSTVIIGTCGLGLTVAIATGIGRAVALRRTDEIILLVYVGLVAMPTLMFNVYGTHYFLRLLPVLIVFGAGGIIWVSSRLERTVSRHAWIGILVLVAAQPAIYSVEYVHYVLTNTDTRTRAREWLYQEVPFGETIAVQKFHELPAYAPPLNETHKQIEQKLAVVRADGRSSGIALEARLARPRQDTYRMINLSASSFWAAAGPSLENLYHFDSLRSQGVKYVVTSGYSTLLPVNDDGSPIGVLIAARSIDPQQVARYEVFKQRLLQEASLVAEFTARDTRTARRTDSPIDPTVRIYRLH